MDWLMDWLTKSRQDNSQHHQICCKCHFHMNIKKKLLYSHRTSETSGLAFYFLFFTKNCQKHVTELLSRFIQILERGWSARSSAFVPNNANRCQFFHHWLKMWMQHLSNHFIFFSKSFSNKKSLLCVSLNEKITRASDKNSIFSPTYCTEFTISSVHHWFAR